MNPIVRNIIAVIVGLLVGGIVNSLLVGMSGSIVPLPEGVDPNDIESIKANLHLYEAKHFIMPFIAHALGALVGAFVAAKIAANNNMKFAIAIGAFYLLGGIAAVVMIGGPIWFIVLDLVVAYIPMGYLGGKLAGAGNSAE